MAPTMTIDKRITPVVRDEAREHADYLVFDQGLIAAAEAAIALGKPLLLTGEPGIGKSAFAGWLAVQPEPCRYLKFVVKSTTEGNDLFYRFDTLARFRDTQIEAHKSLRGEPPAATERSSELHHYLDYDALGKAILYSHGRTQCESLGLISPVMGKGFYADFPQAPTRSVVLIDEIDKAPRDVPNDILDEVERRAFRIQELGKEIGDNPAQSPIVVITSNSERDLPKPFLRRCIHYHMRLPKEKKALRAILLQIARKRVGARYRHNGELLGEAVALFHHLRGSKHLNHPPSLTELLDWLTDLARYLLSEKRRLAEVDQAKETLKNTLLKDGGDQAQADTSWEQWLEAIEAG